MNALIIYDDFAYATKAQEMFRRAAHRADECLQWIVKPWRLDMLKLPSTAETALSEAADAHLILLSLHHPLSPPFWLQNWLEKWAARRQVQEAALAVWGGGKGDALSANVPPELSKFAARYGLSFLSGDSVHDEEDCAVFQPGARQINAWEDDALGANPLL